MDENDITVGGEFKYDFLKAQEVERDNGEVGKELTVIAHFIPALRL